MQENHSVAYASAALNDQQRYSQIGKELLAILIEWKKFHYYVNGKNIIVEIDQKPLLCLLNKRDRLFLKLQKKKKNSFRTVYEWIWTQICKQLSDIEVAYICWHQTYVADALLSSLSNTKFETDFLNEEAEWGRKLKSNNYVSIFKFIFLIIPCTMLFRISLEFLLQYLTF